MHIPVMLSEVINFLDLKKGDWIFDGTFGNGGYSLAIAEKVGKNGGVLAVDADKEAIKIGKKKIKELGLENIILVQDNFNNLEAIVKKYLIKEKKLAGIVLDLGLSSMQLSDNKRGFSFQSEGELDMNFGLATQMKTAFKIVNEANEQELKKIITEYGEERMARIIARAIVEARKIKSIKTAKELSEIISSAIPARFRSARIHPATRTFQALRIASNDELGNLKKILEQSLNCLKKNGRIVIVSYHSLEDRIVKNFFKQESKKCICPSSAPFCTCLQKPKLQIFTKKPILPSIEEIKINPRARSAKLRCATVC